MTPSEQAIEESNPSDWQYTAEGGANLVVSYTGSSGLLFGRCLRLRKAQLANNDPSSDEEDPAIAFNRDIIAPLLGRQHLPTMEPVELSTRFLAGLKGSVENMRPKHRRVIDEIDQESNRGVLVVDLVGQKGDMETMSFELKPKWAFLPLRPESLRAKTSALKQQYCRTCALRATRSGDSHPIHRPCPLLLFSQDPRTVRQGVEGLYKLWKSERGAGNSFRVFKGGLVVGREEDLPAELLSSLASAIANSEAFAQIARLQKLLDPIDIEGVAALGYKPPPASPLWSNQLRNLATSLPETPVGVAPETLAAMYLLGATFKDCSVFVTFKGGLLSTIKVIDLDPKAPERMEKYETVDKKLWNDFRMLSTDMVPCTTLLQNATKNETDVGWRPVILSGLLMVMLGVGLVQVR